MWTEIAIATSQSCSMIPISSKKKKKNIFFKTLFFSPSSFWTILGTHLGTSSPLKWAWLSPAFTAFLLLCVSGVPLVEKAGMKKWGKDQKYLEYVQTTPLLLPKAFLGLFRGISTSMFVFGRVRVPCVVFFSVFGPSYLGLWVSWFMFVGVVVFGLLRTQSRE